MRGKKLIERARPTCFLGRSFSGKSAVVVDFNYQVGTKALLVSSSAFSFRWNRNIQRRGFHRDANWGTAYLRLISSLAGGRSLAAGIVSPFTFPSPINCRRTGPFSNVYTPMLAGVYKPSSLFLRSEVCLSRGLILFELGNKQAEVGRPRSRRGNNLARASPVYPTGRLNVDDVRRRESASRRVSTDLFNEIQLKGNEVIKTAVRPPFLTGRQVAPFYPPPRCFVILIGASAAVVDPVHTPFKLHVGINKVLNFRTRFIPRSFLVQTINPVLGRQDA